MDFKKWLFCRLVSKKLLSARPFSFFDEDSPNGEPGVQGTVERTNMVGTGYASSANSDYDQVTELSASSQLVSTSTSDPAQYECDDKDADPLKRVESLQIKFLRLVRRIGESPENNVVAQVLYRLHLASLIRATDSEIKRTCLKINKARAIAAEQEATNRPPLDFSIKILLLAKLVWARAQP
uniref:Uncharacterized protein n=1 Tax=Ananas comosus var. bracteatus TaxID=296719 RepID=A0A6V7PLZ6_ANACO|nr:unnamed protein product [Ananas comosus var. bracteatus]